MKRAAIFLPLLLVTLAVTGEAPPADPAVTPAPALDTITEPEIRGHLGFIASDLLEGRDTASRGEILAGEYIAAQLRGMDANPAGERRGRRPVTYFQRFPLIRTTPRMEDTRLSLSLDSDGSSRTMHLWPATVFFFSNLGIAPG